MCPFCPGVVVAVFAMTTPDRNNAGFIGIIRRGLAEQYGIDDYIFERYNKKKRGMMGCSLKLVSWDDMFLLR